MVSRPGASSFRFLRGPMAASAVRLASLCLIWASSCCCICHTGKQLLEFLFSCHIKKLSSDLQARGGSHTCTIPESILLLPVLFYQPGHRGIMKILKFLLLSTGFLLPSISTITKTTILFIKNCLSKYYTNHTSPI